MSLDYECYEKVGFYMSARGLPKMDIMSHTDAFAVVYLKQQKGDQYDFVGRTGVIKDTEIPDWPDLIEMNYNFEEIQLVVVKVYDQQEGVAPEDINKHHFIGEAQFKLADLLQAQNQAMGLALGGGPNAKGNLLIRAEPIANTRDIFVCDFRAHGLKNVDGFFGKSDPFLCISRMYEDGQWKRVFQNEHLENKLNPHWPTARIPLGKLCNGDVYRPIRLEVYDFNESGRHKFLGQVQTNVKNMCDNNQIESGAIELEDEHGKTGKNGNITPYNAMMEAHPTFSQYIMGGCEVKLQVAIDFTGSNGDPHQPDSLHYVDITGREKNPYEQVIEQIGSIVESYDTDKAYPVHGFGAKVVGPDGQWTGVQHCFPVYSGNAESVGVPGLLKAYHDCREHVQMSGPTLFQPLLESTARTVMGYGCSQQTQKYGVLLIITDGMINDINATIGALIAASNTPLSVVVVGVGSADFTGMEVIDGDRGLLKSGSHVASRDIVQFISMRDYATKGSLTLAQDTLKEIPEQLCQFMESQGIMPNYAKPDPLEGFAAVQI